MTALLTPTRPTSVSDSIPTGRDGLPVACGGPSEVDATGAVARMRELLVRAADGDEAAAGEALATFDALDIYLQDGNLLPAPWRTAKAWQADASPVEVGGPDGDWFLFDDESSTVTTVRVVSPEIPVQPPQAMLPAPASHLIPAAPAVSTTTPTAGTPLAEVQDWIRQRLDDGVRCVACDQFAKVYPRNIYATLAKHLIAMWQKGGPERRFLSLSKDLNQGGGDMGKMRYWGLVEEEKTVFPDTGEQGYWRLTDLGVKFVRGEITLPKYAYVYDGVCLRLDGPQVSIREALGKKFDYAALMAN